MRFSALAHKELGVSEDEWGRVLRWVAGHTNDATKAERRSWRKSIYDPTAREARKQLKDMTDQVDGWRYVRHTVLYGEDRMAFAWAKNAMGRTKVGVLPKVPTRFRRSTT